MRVRYYPRRDETYNIFVLSAMILKFTTVTIRHNTLYCLRDAISDNLLKGSTGLGTYVNMSPHRIFSWVKIGKYSHDNRPMLLV